MSRNSKRALHADNATVPMVAASLEFQPLPEGALVGKDSYYITRVCTEGPAHNIYAAEEATATLPCPNPSCGHPDNPAGTAMCESCGTELEGVAALRRRYQLHEYSDYANVAVAAYLAAQGLRHTALMPQSYFAERPYGQQDRHYLVLPDPMPVSASQLPAPQKLVRALNWGIQLADGLAFMHQHGIGWRQITAEQIVVQERSAMWFDFVAACELVGDDTETARQQAKDVTGLTQVLYHLARGEGESAPSAELPPPLSILFDRVLNDDHHNISAVQLAQELRFFVDTIRRPVAVRTRIGRCTDVGMVRDLNEDSLLTLELDRVRCSISQPISLVAVADGMGGHAAGDVASGLAVDTLAEKMVTQLLGPHLTGNGDAESLQPRVWLESAVEAANQVVYSQRVAAHSNMGTTLVAAIVVGDTAQVGNVGDSRAYLINENGIHQITTDHSLVERLVAMGHIDHEEARFHPQRNVIYRTLGDRLEVEADFFTQRLQPGDRLLLCSDGLTATVEDQDIWNAVMRCPSPQEACGQLVQMSNDNGGQDNTTVIVLQVHQGSN